MSACASNRGAARSPAVGATTACTTTSSRPPTPMIGPATRTRPASCASGVSASRPGPPVKARSGSRTEVVEAGGTLWHGRFADGPAEELLAYTASLPFDRRLAPDDIAGSRAHVKGLVRAELLDGDEAA